MLLCQKNPLKGSIKGAKRADDADAGASGWVVRVGGRMLQRGRPGVRCSRAAAWVGRGAVPHCASLRTDGCRAPVEVCLPCLALAPAYLLCVCAQARPPSSPCHSPASFPSLPPTPRPPCTLHPAAGNHAFETFTGAVSRDIPDPKVQAALWLQAENSRRGYAHHQAQMVSQ